MARLKEIDKSTLKVGDMVGVCTATRIDWSYFRYDRVMPKTIARITPARTKFVTTDGCEYGKYDVFYEINEEVRRRNYVADCAKRIRENLKKINERMSRGAVLGKPDDKIIKISEILKELCKEIEEE